MPPKGSLFPVTYLLKPRKDSSNVWGTEEMRDESERHILTVKMFSLRPTSWGNAQRK